MTELTDLIPEALLGLSAILYLTLLGFMLIWGLVRYVLTGISLHSLSKRRGLEGGWLCWVPLIRYWVLGALSDHYQRAAQNLVRRRRRSLMSLMVGIFMSLVLGSIFFYTFLFLRAQMGSGRYVDGASVSVLGVTAGLLAGAAVLMLLAFTVQKHIAFYQLYRSCRPKQAVLFLILGLVFSFLRPIFLMICRKQDQGLPKPEALISGPPIS